MSPKINIVTRVSRKESFTKCYESVNSQTYKNINHICTYQNQEIHDFLLSFDNINLLKVPNLKSIDGLFYSFNSHCDTDKFITPNWKMLDRKVESTNQIEQYSLIINSRKIQKRLTEDVWFYCHTPNFTFRWVNKHFPYNIFLKIAEKKFVDGWVIYLDDDDHFAETTSLEQIIQEINLHDDDTIHVWRTKFKNGVFKPTDNYWTKMSCGYPFILNEVGGSVFTFHTKWADWTVWDEWSGSDYRTLKSLEEIIPKKNFIDKIFIHLS